MKRIFIFCLIISTVFSCSVINVFSPTNPTNIDDIYDSEVLISLGEKYLSEGKYEEAFNAFRRALYLSPNKSKAMDGISTAYIQLHISFTNLIKGITNNSFSNIAPLNTLYDVSFFVSSNLKNIINNESDGVIVYYDINVNLTFYILNNFYSIFALFDFNNNLDVENDTNDLIMISPDFQIDTNNSQLFKIVNNLQGANPNPIYLFKVPQIIARLNDQYKVFTNNIGLSKKSISNIYINLQAEESKNLLTNITKVMDELCFNMENFILTLNFSNTNHSVFSMTNIYNITNFVEISDLTLDNTSTSNYLWDAGYGPDDYDSFTNDMYNAGITNFSDLTNIIPGLSNANEYISNYFNL